MHSNVVNDELWAKLKRILDIHEFKVIHKTVVEMNDDDLVRLVETIRDDPHEVHVINYWYIDDEDNDTSISVHATRSGAQDRCRELCAEQYDERMVDDDSSLMVCRRNDEGQPTYEITTEDKTVIESWTVYTTMLEN